jgi:predicted transcriptional regulator
MGQFKPPAVRSRCIELRQLGWKRLDIAKELDISLGSVKKYIKLSTVRPDNWLYCNYRNCGRKSNFETEKSYRLVRLIKRRHPT